LCELGGVSVCGGGIIGFGVYPGAVKCRLTGLQGRHRLCLP